MIRAEEGQWSGTGRPHKQVTNQGCRSKARIRIVGDTGDQIGNMQAEHKEMGASIQRSNLRPGIKAKETRSMN